MARVCSPSPEADLAPAVQTPFDWEAAPSRAAARKSTKSGVSGNLERDSDEVPPIPFPPGRRPKDGFYLPYSREFGEFPDVQLKSIGNCPKQRKLFDLKFHGSFKKPSRMRLPFQSSSKAPKASHVIEDLRFSIFNPSSGQRFGSSITNRMPMQLQKKQPLWRRCLPSKPERVNGGSSYIDPNRRRRLDEGLDDGYVTAADSPVSGPSLPSSPGHGHYSSSNSLHVMVNSSRFMASILISLCPDDTTDSQLDAENGNFDDYIDNFGISHLTTPKTKSSLPMAFEVKEDPTSQTVTSQEKLTCTCKYCANMVESSPSQRGEMSRRASRSLHEEPAIASRSPSGYSRNEKLVWPRSHRPNDSASKLNESNQENSADLYPAFFKASSNRELLQSRETYKPFFSWKPCTEYNCQNEEPIENSVAALEPSHSEFADQTNFDDHEEEDKRRRRDQRLFSTGSNKSSSLAFDSLHKIVWSRPNSLTLTDVDNPVPSSENIVPHSIVGYLSPPRILIEDLNFTSSSDKSKPFARWRSTVEPFAGGSLEQKGAFEPLDSLNILQKQALQRSTTPIKIKVNDLKQIEKSSILRPATLKASHIYDSDESSDDCDCSTDSSSYETSSIVSPHMLPNFASPKPASPKLLKPNLDCQPQVCPFMENHELPGPSFKQIMMARSHSVRTSPSRRFLAQECQEHTNFKGPSHLPVPTCRLAKKSSGSNVMSKVALFESKAGGGKFGQLTSYT